MKAIIDTEVVFLHRDVTIHSAIVKMKDAKKSSALILNDENEVVGILTERDIFRKIALIDVQDKLSFKVSTVMSFPVNFCQNYNLVAQIQKFHQEYGFRHFPIIKKDAKSNKKEDIAGMVSDTSIFKYYIKKM